MELSDVKNGYFRENGFMVVENILPPDVFEALRQRADAIARDVDNYNRRDKEERDKIEARYADDPAWDEGETAVPAGVPIDKLEDLPEIEITDRHARRGNRVYPFRQQKVDRAAREEALATDDPFNHISVLNHLADNDEVCREIAGHPNIMSVLRELLSPDVKLWFDHIFSKPPYNDFGPYGGANRYHQDGFFQFSKRSVTCWISLDGLTLENGPFHYIPLTAGYGQFQFDALGEGIGPKELAHERVLILNPGDAVFHDRWTVHATAPNESNCGRRGWALHYADAESRWGDYANDPGRPPARYLQTAEGNHLREGKVHGNRYYQLVAGKESPKCI